MPVIVVNGDSDFSRKFSAANGKAVFIDFTASWCGPCQYIAPVFNDLANQYKGSVFLKVDVDECRDTAAQHGVNAMPTFMAFVGGQKKATIQGADENGLRSMVAKYASTTAAWSGTGQRLSGSSSSTTPTPNSRPRAAPSAGAPGPDPLQGLNQAIETVNTTLHGYGLNDFMVGGFTVQPSHLLIAVALLILLGPFGLVIGGAICFFTQPRGAGGARQSSAQTSGDSGTQGGRQQRPPTARPFGGSGHRLGGN